MADQYMQGAGGLRIVTTLAGTEILLAEIASPSAETVVIPLPVLLAYFFGDYQIGIDGANGIVTNQAIQTLYYKILETARLNSPNINEAVVLTATSTTLNKVAAHLLGTADKHASDKITHTSAGGSDVKAALDYLFNGLEAALALNLTHVLLEYQVEWTQSGTDNKVINEEDMLTACGIDPLLWVMAPTVRCMVTEIDGNSEEVAGTAVAKWVRQTENSQAHLDYVSVSGLENAVKYGLVVSFKLLQKASGGA